MPDESPFASVRELADTERRITTAMMLMKHELLTAIQSSDSEHDRTHELMRSVGDSRHRRIDDWLGQEALEDAQRTGMMTAGVYTLRVFRFVNEFRWLIVAVLAALVLALNGGAHLTLSV
jgi:hypothetical protein